MSTKRALTEFRDTKLYLTAAGSVGAAAVAAPLDAYKAAIRKVEEIESTYATLGSFTDLSAVDSPCFGTLAHQVHIFTITTTVATGVYLMVYKETVPDPTQAS